MKSIKPGRGPSMMSGVMSVAVGIFGLFWTIMAASIGGGFMALFGLVFIGSQIHRNRPFLRGSRRCRDAAGSGALRSK